MKIKGLLIGILVVLVLAVSGLTYAYWAKAIKGADYDLTDSVSVGTGKEVSTTVNVTGASGQILVPAGRAADSNEEAVEEVVLTYAVEWDEEGDAADGALGTLVVSLSNIAIGEDLQIGAKYAHVVITSGNSLDITLNGAPVYVVITVTLDEPTKLDYAKVAGKEITFDLNFAVNAK
jgi:hypothetical protein